MPRQLRIEYPGAVYPFCHGYSATNHVMNRGDRRKPIFSDDVDRLGFIETLGDVCDETDWQMPAFV
jgi:hypothetical protein